jgi:putative endonuclease
MDLALRSLSSGSRNDRAREGAPQECQRQKLAKDENRVRKRDNTAWFNVADDPGVYYVYILASRKHGTLYIGVTNNLIRRVYEHRSDVVRGFSARYQVHLLVWFESYDDMTMAITREKELKKWRRDWKVNLIERSNPEWVDLYPALASWA